jgi:YidC/Oxa1 family membrane protein insertase
LIDSITFKDFGLAVIVITLIVRAIIWPLYSKSLHGQKALKEIQPEISALQKKKQRQASGNAESHDGALQRERSQSLLFCLPTLLQLPLLIGLYWVFIKFKDPSFVQYLIQAMES